MLVFFAYTTTVHMPGYTLVLEITLPEKVIGSFLRECARTLRHVGREHKTDKDQSV